MRNAECGMRSAECGVADSVDTVSSVLRSGPVRIGVTALVSALLVFLGIQDVGADTAGTALYNQANAFYRDGKYEEAVAKYEEAVATGVRSGALYYNLGNACFRARRVGRAILWYERALKLIPRDLDVRANLRFANMVKVDKDPPVDENPIVDLLRNVQNFLTLDEQALLLSLFLFLLFGSLVALLFVRSARFLLLSVSIALGVLVIALGFSFAAKLHTRELVEAGVILAPEVDARSGPGDEHTTILVLHEGTKVMIERSGEGWTLIRLANGVGGWIPADVMEKV